MTKLIVAFCNFANTPIGGTVYIDIGKTVEHNKNYLLLVTQCYCWLHNATSFDPAMGSSSGKEQKLVA
jgi:hypothetical protein